MRERRFRIALSFSKRAICLMETLRLEDLLPFLNARSDWTLCCKNGKYSLRFGRKKFKFKGVTAAATRGRGRRGGTANITGQKRAAAGDDFMRAKWLREIRTAGLSKIVAARFRFSYVVGSMFMQLIAVVNVSFDATLHIEMCTK